MTEPLFLKPVFHEKVWGGTGLKTKFNYDIPSDTTGECWGISGHPHGRTSVLNGPYTGQFLDDIWAHHPELFGHHDVIKPFPILTKILDAHDNLSIQVHPDDAYAAIHEHELGKTECWYVLDAAPGATIFYGHHATNQSELTDWVTHKQWQKLFRKVPVKAGDFFYVPSGTVHALGKGVMVLETQQSSDSTYRIYDFDRVNRTTHQKRELHIQQALDTIQVPHHDPQLHIQTKIDGDLKTTTFVESPYFSVYRWDLTTGSATLHQDMNTFTLLSVITGTGTLTTDQQTYSLTKGDHLVLPSTLTNWQLNGTQLEVIASTPGPKVP